MGREATITFEQVAAAAEALQGAGAKPTSRAVRECLGNTGSMGTVNKLLQAWRAGLQRQAADPAVPASVQRAILAFVGQELAGATAALTAELAEQRQESADLAADNERQAADLAQQQGALAALHAELAMLQGRLAQMEAESAMLRVELDKERQGRVAAEREAAIQAAQLAAERERAGEHAARAAQAERQAQSTTQALASANIAIQAGQARLESAARELEDAKQAAAEARAAARRSGEEAAELRGKLAAAAPAVWQRSNK